MTVALLSLRRRTLLELVAVAAALAGCGGAESADPTLEPAISEPGFFGINGQRLQPMAADGRVELLDRHLGSVAGLGVDFVRASFSWPAVEPLPPDGADRRYDFRGTDAWVGALARRGLTWYVTLKGNPTPGWALGAPAGAAGCGGRAPPARAADFAALAAAVVTRYGRGGSFWAENAELPERPVSDIEIWNEPNFGMFWCPHPDPAAYAKLLDTAAQAIHEVDPRAEVVLGGLAAFRTGVAAPGQAPRMAAPEFLGAVARAAPGLDRRIAAVGIHPYGRDSSEVLAKVAWLRAAVDHAGLADVPLSVNEVGWHVAGSRGESPPVSEEERAELLERVTVGVAVSGCGIAGYAPHTWITEEREPLDPEDWFGLADPAEARPYAGAEAYADTVRGLRGGDLGDDPSDPAC